MPVSIRRKARELALQTLYQREMGEQAKEKGLQLIRENFSANKKALSYAAEIITGVYENMAAINELIEKQSANWRLDRMSVIDRNIMRVAAFELCYQDDIPATVAINEALEIAKRFSTDEAPQFINGVLDAIRKNMQ